MNTPFATGATFDIDILIRPESLDGSFEIAKEFGFEGRHKDLIDIDRMRNEED